MSPAVPGPARDSRKTANRILTVTTSVSVLRIKRLPTVQERVLGRQSGLS
jgi:hypothetical protein